LNLIIITIFTVALSITSIGFGLPNYYNWSINNNALAFKPTPSNTTPSPQSNNNITNSAIQNSTTPTTAIASDNSFKTYENSTYGIKIQYPSTWIVKQSPLNETGKTGVRFVSPTGVAAVAIYYSPWPNITFNEGIGNMLNAFNSANDLKLIESTPTVLAANPAYKFVYTEMVPEHGAIKEMTIVTHIDSKLFQFLYTGLLSDYANHLPAVQRMVDTFQVIMPISKE
jgi:PsbP-like protein